MSHDFTGLKWASLAHDVEWFSIKYSILNKNVSLFSLNLKWICTLQLLLVSFEWTNHLNKLHTNTHIFIDETYHVHATQRNVLTIHNKHIQTSRTPQPFQWTHEHIHITTAMNRFHPSPFSSPSSFYGYELDSFYFSLCIKRSGIPCNSLWQRARQIFRTKFGSK